MFYETKNICFCKPVEFLDFTTSSFIKSSYLRDDGWELIRYSYDDIVCVSHYEFIRNAK